MSSVAAFDSASSVRQALQARIGAMQSTKLEEQGFAVLPQLRSLLPRGLRRGSVYSISGSTTLALALMAEASRQGEWCGVLGEPDVGIEAAAEWGISLDRLVCVHDGGERWVTTLAAMTDVLGLVIARPPRALRSLSPAESSRLSARLRQSRSSVLVLGDWPEAEASLRVAKTEWSGLGAGHGNLGSRRMRIDVRGRGGEGALRQATLVVPVRP